MNGTGSRNETRYFVVLNSEMLIKADRTSIKSSRDLDLIVLSRHRFAQNRMAGNGLEASTSVETLTFRQRSASAARVASA